MTDYDPIRTCCSGAAICNRCWKFISAAVEVLHEALTLQFGFRRLLWVYSGRRGIHCWVSDKEAMGLTDEQRKAITKYLTVITGGKDVHKKVDVRFGLKPLPPSLSAVLGPLADLFSDLILKDQKCFDSQEGWEALLHLIPDMGVVHTLRNKWEDDSERDSADKWHDFKTEVKKFKKDSSQRVNSY